MANPEKYIFDVCVMTLLWGGGGGGGGGGAAFRCHSAGVMWLINLVNQTINKINLVLFIYRNVTYLSPLACQQARC